MAALRCRICHGFCHHTAQQAASTTLIDCNAIQTKPAEVSHSHKYSMYSQVMLDQKSNEILLLNLVIASHM
jgi:hypothetical protein